MQFSDGSAAYCLNGWWDFLPIFSNISNTGNISNISEQVPADGWEKHKYLVPSFWTKPLGGVRKKGEKYYSDQIRTQASITDFDEFLFDSFDYPKEWSQTRNGWVRREITLDALEPSKRYFLVFEAIMPQSILFVNGRKICSHIHPTLPMEADVTDFLIEGVNEIAVLVKDYVYVSRDDFAGQGQANVPTGDWVPRFHCGIWQNVWLYHRLDVYCSDVTIRTSTRRNEIEVIWEITNSSNHKRKISISAAIVDWSKEKDFDKTQEIAELIEQNLTIDANSTIQVNCVKEWKDAEWWSPENPKLYQLRTTLTENKRKLETTFERFGFREVWIEGYNLMLNDHPIHLFSDCGHKVTACYYTEKYIRRFFSMLRDGNMNHTRLHTHPNPQLIIDIADEMGILITDETGMDGAGRAQGANSPDYWIAAEDHIRRFVKRDKNHPSVILWSVENEMRHNDSTEACMKHLPRLRKLFEQLDPTRPAYHEGDTSLWNEKSDDINIISRHYGKECAGIGWWDKSKPLHCGEIGIHHYAAPHTTQHLGGDKVYADFSLISEVAGRDCQMIIESARAMGVCCLAPWNQCCLEILRPYPETIKPNYDDYTTPGVKPLIVQPYSSEFDFWSEKGKGYATQISFDLQTRGFRPFLVTDLSLNKTYFTSAKFQRNIYLVNDTLSAQNGTLYVKLSNDKQTICDINEPVNISRGQVEMRTITVDIPDDIESGNYQYSVQFRLGDNILDSWQRTIKIERSPFINIPNKSESKITSPIAVLGQGLLRDILEKMHLDYHYISSLQELSSDDAKILIMEKSTIKPASQQNKQIRQFARNGGRVIIMEQGISVFPGLKIEPKPVLTAFIRSFEHPIFDGLTDEDLAFWGEDPYAALTGDSYVAKYMYRKDDGGYMHILADSGEGSFGKGNLDYCPLFEAYEADGLIIACQFRITDKITSIPAAQRLFVNMLRRAQSYKKSPQTELIEIAGSETDKIHSLIEAARSGKTVIVNNIPPTALEVWSEALGVKLELCDISDVYQAVRAADDKILSGVSNEDTCGIETWPYTREEAENFVIATTVFKPNDKIEELLITPEQSGLKELMVLNGKTELLRAHTLTRFVYGNEKPPKAIVMGKIRIGSGCILINQFAPPVNKRQRFNRLFNRIKANLGHHSSVSLLDGESVPDSSAVSQGYPRKVHIANIKTDAALMEKFMQATVYTGERMPSNAILGLADWTAIESDDGIWNASGMDISEDLYLFYVIHSPVARKDTKNTFDAPDPETKTCLDIIGEGTVEIFINGKSIAILSITAGHSTVSDIALEQGYNYIIVRWDPLSQRSTISMKWHNLLHQPETSFDFISWI